MQSPCTPTISRLLNEMVNVSEAGGAIATEGWTYPGDEQCNKMVSMCSGIPYEAGHGDGRNGKDGGSLPRQVWTEADSTQACLGDARSRDWDVDSFASLRKQFFHGRE